MPVGPSDEERRYRWRVNIEGFLQKFEEQLLVQHENGIEKFETPKRYYQEAHVKLEEAHRQIQRPLDEFDYALTDRLSREAQMAFDTAINAAPWWWRWLYAYGYLYFTLYLVAIGLVLFWFCKLDTHLAIPMIKVPLWALLLGVAGGAMQGIWWLRERSATYTIRQAWVIYLIGPPFYGAVMGIIAYLLDELLHTEMAVMLVSFMGGFSSGFVIRYLSRVFGHV